MIVLNESDGVFLTSVSPAIANVSGGTVLTVEGAGFTAVGDTLATVGGQPAQVLSVTPTMLTASVPAALEASGQDLSVTIENSQGSGQLPHAFQYSPSLSASSDGSATAGGHLIVDWVVDPLPIGSQAVYLWLGHPATGTLSISVPAYSGLFQVPIFLTLLSGFPAAFESVAFQFGPLVPGVVGVPFSVQALVTGEGKPSGTFTNVASFVIH
jgi:hypothetical protein